MIKTSRIVIANSLGNFAAMEQSALRSEDVTIFDDVTIAEHDKKRAAMINAHRNRYRKSNGNVLCPICRARQISSNADSCLGCKEKKEQELNAV